MASAGAIYRILSKEYPDACCELDFDTPFQLLVATVLSAQCTDKRVNAVTPALFAKYPSAREMASARLADIERLVKSTGFFRAKARNIKTLSQELISKYDGEVPAELEKLVLLPGVGRKTANVVLGNAFGIASGVVVDTHVLRLSQRMGLTKQKTPEKVEADLQKIIPKKHWVTFPHWLITHGRGSCNARKPACAECVLEAICPKVGVSKSKTIAKK